MSDIGKLLGSLTSCSCMRSQKLFVQARQTVTRCGVIAHALSLIRVILFFVCVRKDRETDQFKPSFID